MVYAWQKVFKKTLKNSEQSNNTRTTEQPVPMRSLGGLLLRVLRLLNFLGYVYIKYSNYDILFIPNRDSDLENFTEVKYLEFNQGQRAASTYVAIQRGEGTRLLSAIKNRSQVPALTTCVKQRYHTGANMKQKTEPISISEWQKEVHKNAVAHGFWENPRTIGELLMLITSEVTEAFEEVRNGHEVNETYYKDGKMEGVPSELADVVIRVMDFCEHYGIELEKAIAEKHQFNKTRPYKHGGKKL